MGCDYDGSAPFGLRFFRAEILNELSATKVRPQKPDSLDVPPQFISVMERYSPILNNSNHRNGTENANVVDKTQLRAPLVGVISCLISEEFGAIQGGILASPEVGRKPQLLARVRIDVWKRSRTGKFPPNAFHVTHSLLSRNTLFHPTMHEITTIAGPPHSHPHRRSQNSL